MTGTRIPLLQTRLFRVLVASLSLPLIGESSDHPSGPGTSSPVFELHLNGVAVPVIAYKDIHYAHFTLDGPGKLEITTSDGEVENARIQPDALGIVSTLAGDRVSFTIPRPMQLVAQLDFREKLFLFADPPHPPAPADAINVTELDINGDGVTDQTARLQRAIDTLPKGGTLLLPAGHYRSGTLRLRSDMRLHLDAGALLQASEEHTAITPIPGSTSFIGYLVGTNLENVSISGAGTIDANGYHVRKAYEKALGIKKQAGRILHLKNLKHISVTGVTLRDSYSWNVQMSESDDITMQWVKILSDVRLSNHDGIDMVSCSEVKVSDCFIFCEDDGLSPKAAKGRDVVENHEYRNIVIWAHKANGIRIGSESDCRVMRNLLFENIYILNGSNGIRLDTTEGAIFENITFRNVRIDDLLQHYDGRYQRNLERRMIEPSSHAIVLLVTRQKERPPGAIRGITFEDVHWNDARIKVRFDIPSALVKEIEEKKKKPPISNISFRRCSRAGIPILSGADMGANPNDGFVSEMVTFE
jgi:hypothetical protein